MHPRALKTVRNHLYVCLFSAQTATLRRGVGGYKEYVKLASLHDRHDLRLNVFNVGDR